MKFTCALWACVFVVFLVSCGYEDKVRIISERAEYKLKNDFAAIGDFFYSDIEKSIKAERNSLKPNQIPIYPERWYQLNNTKDDFAALFDGVLKENVKRSWGKVLENFDSYYPLKEGEEMEIDSIRFYDYKGTYKNTPMTLSVITDTWERIPIASFTGEHYELWVGPYPEDPKNFKLKQKIKNVKYLVINSFSDYPTEIELYGNYKKGVEKTAVSVRKEIKLKNTMGVNAFEWDIVDGGRGSVINEKKFETIKYFSGIRHYLDWERLETQEGVYAFDPTISGGWDYDLIYSRLKGEGIEVLTCLKTIPKWMRLTYPEDKRNSENVPLRYGKDFSDPQSYIEQAKLGFQFAARYGRNKDIDLNLLSKVKTGKVYPGAKNSPVRTLETGLDLIKYIECDNERDKWWKGRKAYQTAREYAANMSAFYDGHMNSMGPGVGVKNADPTMQVVIGGLTGPNSDYLKGMIDWCREFRGYKEDGSVDLCWDIVNYHQYSSDGVDSQGNKATRSAAPELSTLQEGAEKMLSVTNQHAPGMPVWMSELGFGENQQGVLKAIPIGDKSALETQADWILRSAFLYARLGVEKVFFYQLYDDKPSSAGKFSSMGLANKKDQTPKLAAEYLKQTMTLLGDYSFSESLHNDPVVDRYELNGQSAYVLYVPDEKGRKQKYLLNLDNAKTVKIYRPGSGKMKEESKTISSGKLELLVTETPLYVIPGE